jgi:hypothetical protein
MAAARMDAEGMTQLTKIQAIGLFCAIKQQCLLDPYGVSWYKSQFICCTGSAG